MRFARIAACLMLATAFLPLAAADPFDDAQAIGDAAEAEAERLYDEQGEPAVGETQCLVQAPHSTTTSATANETSNASRRGGDATSILVAAAIDYARTGDVRLSEIDKDVAAAYSALEATETGSAPDRIVIAALTGNDAGALIHWALIGVGTGEDTEARMACQVPTLARGASNATMNATRAIYNDTRAIVDPIVQEVLDTVNDTVNDTWEAVWQAYNDTGETARWVINETHEAYHWAVNTTVGLAQKALNETRPLVESSPFHETVCGAREAFPEGPKREAYDWIVDLAYPGLCAAEDDEEGDA